MGNLPLKVKRLHPDAKMPVYATPGAACFDLHAIEGIFIAGANRAAPNTGLFRTGLAFEVPDGHVMLVFGRSGHAYKHGLRLANCVGVIDSDFRGEVMVKLTCDASHGQPIASGERIAQAMVIPVQQVAFIESEELSSTARGEGGFGSTGK